MSTDFDAALLGECLSKVFERHEAYEEMLKALEFVDRLFSTIGGAVDARNYGLIANSPECGPMINAVRKAIDKARGAQ